MTASMTIVPFQFRSDTSVATFTAACHTAWLRTNSVRHCNTSARIELLLDWFADSSMGENTGAGESRVGSVVVLGSCELDEAAVDVAAVMENKIEDGCLMRHIAGELEASALERSDSTTSENSCEGIWWKKSGLTSMPV